jgi:hypothetical protein
MVKNSQRRKARSRSLQLVCSVQSVTTPQITSKVSTASR